MRALLLGCSQNENVLNTLEKLLELEKVVSEVLFFDKCNEEELIKKLKGSDLFLLYPKALYRNIPEISGEDDKQEEQIYLNRIMAEAVTAGYLMSHKGHFLVFAPDSENLSPLLSAEPAVKTIGEAIGYFRRERKVFDSNMIMIKARRIISEAGLGFSNRGLIEAVENGMYAEVQAFFDAGFSTETETEKGVPIVSLAIRKGNLEIIRLLMSYNARLNLIARDRGASPLIDAVSSDQPEIANLLIEAGADLDFKNKNGQTALVVAIGLKMEKIAELLIEKGADITIKDSLGMTAVEYAKLFSLTNIYEKLQSAAG